MVKPGVDPSLHCLLSGLIAALELPSAISQDSPAPLRLGVHVIKSKMNYRMASTKLRHVSKGQVFSGVLLPGCVLRPAWGAYKIPLVASRWFSVAPQTINTSTSAQHHWLRASLLQQQMSTNSSEFARVNKAFDESRVFFMKYAIKPLPADPYERQQWVMASLHLVVVESFQNAYKRADTISPNEEQSFTKYCLFAHEFLDHHHWFEETIGFPALAPEFQCDAISEHAAFGEGMDRWQAYLASILGLVKNDEGKLIPSPNVVKVPYNAQKMKKCIEDMSTPLLTHLRHEIDWLDPEKLRACGLPRSKLEAAEAASQRHFAREVDHFSQSYFTFAHLPPDCQFPPAPWFVKKIVVPWVFYWKHRDAWRFVPAFN